MRQLIYVVGEEDSLWVKWCHNFFFEMSVYGATTALLMLLGHGGKFLKLEILFRLILSTRWAMGRGYLYGPR